MESKLDSLFSDAVTNINKNKLVDYIKQLNSEELSIFNDIVDELYMLKYNGRKDCKITNNSIKLCIRIFKELNIKTFPHIDTCTKRGFSLKDGTFSFTMRTLDYQCGGVISSYTRTNEFLKNKAILYKHQNCFNRMIDVKINKE